MRSDMVVSNNASFACTAAQEVLEEDIHARYSSDSLDSTHSRRDSIHITDGTYI